MIERNFGHVTAYNDNNEWRFDVDEFNSCSEKELDRLVENIKSAQQWVGNQKNQNRLTLHLNENP